MVWKLPARVRLALSRFYFIIAAKDHKGTSHIQPSANRLLPDTGLLSKEGLAYYTTLVRRVGIKFVSS